MADSPRHPLLELVSLALPTVAQMASYTVMQFIDTWMLSHFGGTAPTAASNSGMLAWTLVAFGMGVLVIVNTLVSQSFGRRDFPECGRYLWQGIWLGLALGLGMIPLRALALPMFRAFGHSIQQASLEATYYRIVILTAWVKLTGSAIGQFFLGVDRPNSVLISAVVGVAINSLAAFALVLGHLGFHPHGVGGAAWAQNIGCTCEMLTLVGLVSRRSIRQSFGLSRMALRWRQFYTLVRVGVPSGLQWFSEVLAWSIFANGVIGLLGPTAMAGNTFMLRYMVVSFLPVYGLSTAVTALVGRYIGRGEPELAIRRAHFGFVVALAYVLGCGAIFVTFRHSLMSVFTSDPEIIRVGSLYLVYAAVYEISDAMYIIYSGGLRGAGDTLVPAVVNACLCWSVTVGGGYCAAKWLTMLGYGGPWLMACIYGQCLGWYIALRFIRAKWKSIDLKTADEITAEAIPARKETSVATAF